MCDSVRLLFFFFLHAWAMNETLGLLSPMFLLDGSASMTDWLAKRGVGLP